MLKILLLLSTTLILFGCGGGGGGGGGGGLNYYETTEYKRQYGLSNINASKIYSYGSGSGVIVAVIDTGVDLDHPDLIDNIASGGYDYVDNDDDANPVANPTNNLYMSHGTHVAGIIAAMKNDVGVHGVAYNAKILALRVGNSQGFVDYSDVESSIDRAIEKNAKVINASFGDSNISESLANKWLSAHDNDIVSVHATGNNGYNNPSYGARLPIVDAYKDLANTLIAVVATDSKNDIADFSNRCGDAQNWCMAAPGVGIKSTVDTDHNAEGNVDGYAIYNGTSMAAPHVAGAVAILRSRWPSKSAAEVVSILYDTATDIGDVGIDAIYGRGLLNLDNAVYPQGLTSIYTASGAKYALNDSTLSSSRFVGDALTLPLKSAVYDKYKRDYYFDLNAAPQKIHTNPLDELRYVNSTVSAEIDSTTKMSIDTNQRSFQVENEIGGGLKFVFAHKQNPAQVFALNHQPNVALSIHPHLQQVKNASTINVINPNRITTSLGIVSGYTDTNNAHPISGVNLSMLTNPTKNLSFLTQISRLEEKQTFLSNYFSGAYKTGTSKTDAVNLIAQLNVTNDLDFITQFSKGYTKVKTLNDSAVSNISPISSKGYSLSIIKNNLSSKNDKLFASIKQPLKVNSGNITLETANGLNLDDSIKFSDQTLSLTPTGTEKEVTLGYLTNYTDDGTMTILLNHRNNPNHNSTATSENQIMIKITKKF